MPKYCTWDGKRDRWVFQLRVPGNLREHFRGVAVIREHIGRVDGAVAAAHAQRRAGELRAQFDRLREAIRGSSSDMLIRPPLTRFTLGKALLPPFLATWRSRECDIFKEALRQLRGAEAYAWEDLQQQLAEQHLAAVSAFRRGDDGPLKAAVEALEQGLHVRLELDPVDRDQVIDEFNSAHAGLIAQFQRVTAGDGSLDAIRPARESQLPLSVLWGESAPQVLAAWREKRTAAGARIPTKTADKYSAIVEDLATVLGRRPVQALADADVTALKTTWRQRGNHPDTIKGKADILKSLLRPYLELNRLDALFPQTCRARKGKAKRLPFSPSQFMRYRAALEQATGISADDIHLVALMLLTGAHLEEVFQLQSADLERTSHGWIVRIAEGLDTGNGDAKLKTTDCARRLPVCVPDEIFPGLSEWLSTQVDAGGFLFENASCNRHGIRSAAASQRLNRVLRKLIPGERRLVLQSMRNTIGQVLRRAHVDPRVRKRFLGHADTDIHDRHYDPAELLDDTDLLPATEAIVRWLRVECLGATEPHGHGDP